MKLFHIMSQEGKSMRQAMRAGKQTCSRHVLQYERNSSATGESCSCKGSMRPLAVMLLKKLSLVLTKMWLIKLGSWGKKWRWMFKTKPNAELLPNCQTASLFGQQKISNKTKFKNAIYRMLLSMERMVASKAMLIRCKFTTRQHNKLSFRQCFSLGWQICTESTHQSSKRFAFKFF